MIWENDFVLSWSAMFRRAKYVVVVEPENLGVEDESWDGKMTAMRKAIENAGRD